MHGPINVKSPNNTSKWQMGFNSAFKGLILPNIYWCKEPRIAETRSENRFRNWHLYKTTLKFNALNPELNPICYLLALLGAPHFLHVSRIRVKSLTIRLLMYIYIYIYIYDISNLRVKHRSMEHKALPLHSSLSFHNACLLTQFERHC